MSRPTDPFENLERQFERMQRQFQEAMKMWDIDQLPMGGESLQPSEMGVDLADRGDEFVLTADVPGFDREDIELKLTDSTVHITARRESEETETDEEFYVKSERARQSMSRSVRLPDRVDHDQVSATYNNGVLTVEMPKTEPDDPEGRSIDIE